MFLNCLVLNTCCNVRIYTWVSASRLSHPLHPVKYSSIFPIPLPSKTCKKSCIFTLMLLKTCEFQLLLLVQPYIWLDEPLIIWRRSLYSVLENSLTLRQESTNQVFPGDEEVSEEITPRYCLLRILAIFLVHFHTLLQLRLRLVYSSYSYLHLLFHMSGSTSSLFVSYLTGNWLN